MMRKTRARRVGAMFVLAVALAYTEACVVVYLREALVPIRRRYLPQAVRQPLPLLTSGQLRQAGSEAVKLLAVEVTREVSPLVVLLAMAWSLAPRGGQGLALFLVGFGLWDIFYYVYLKILLGWPEGLGTWDVLYLIPSPWVAPVWAPLLVSATMVTGGLAALYRGRRLRRSHRRLLPGLLMIGGTAVVLTSFFLPAREAFGAVPERFDWPLFLCGWLLAVTGTWQLLRRGDRVVDSVV